MTSKIVEILIPEYIKEFSCIGSACEDTCCSGWRVNIDEETYKKYKKVSDYKIKSRLEKNIIRNRSNPTNSNFAKMKMKNLKCSFLNENGLCDIQSNLGESFLCDTCTVYPRRYNKVNGVLERSLTVSCPEAARLILLNKEGIKFETGQELISNRDLTSTYIQTDTDKITHWTDLFNEYRYITILILQDRNITLEERLLILALMYDELESCVKSNNLNEIPNVLGRYLQAVENKTFKGEFSNIPKRQDIAIRLSREIVLLRLKEGMSSSRYLECSREMMSGLRIDELISDKEVEEIYGEAYMKYFTPFIKKNEYLIENYLVNYVFKNCMPVDTKSPFESFSRMILHYSLIKLHLVGMSSYNKGLNHDAVIKLIQSMSKTFEHNGQFLEKIMKLIKENDFMTLTYISILIKN